VNRKSSREAFFLIVLAGVMGFTYTLVTKQGFFSEKKPSLQTTAPNLELIPLTKVREFFESRTALFIDSRHEFDFMRGHIRHAINVALNEYTLHRTRLDGIQKDTVLIIYCDGTECNSSIDLAAKLIESGFSNVKIFFGGWQEWKSAGLPVEP